MRKQQATGSGKRRAVPEALGGDGIDDLPDDVLQHVLSFVPTTEAVQTCVLARRWRHLWKSMPILRITPQGRLLNRRGVRKLNRLELCNVVLNNQILNFSSCPALEELWIRSCFIQADLIMSQSLKRLAIIDCVFYLTARTRISAPALVTLELSECWCRTPWLESMPSLVTGSIKLADCDDCCGKEDGGPCFSANDTCENCGANIDGLGDCVILNGLSEAKSLELMAEPSVYIINRDLKCCPTFSKLKTLLLNEWCMKNNLGALMCLLQHTPVLEKLTIQLCQTPSSPTGTEGSYNLTGQPFASNTLKMLEIKCEKIDERVHKILTFLSTNGIHIEQINIQQSIGSSEEPKGFPQESRAGPSQARTRRVLPSQNAQLKSMVEQVAVRQEQIIAQQEHILEQQQNLQVQQQQIIAGQQEQKHLLTKILACFSEHSASCSQKTPPAAHTERLE